MQLDKIAYIIQYINGRVDDRSDDIIADSVLYDYICRILDALTEKVNAIDSIKDTVKEITSDYEEKIEGARERLDSALEIIVIAYYASLVKRHADELLAHI
jgi:flagellin-specific chaperone FliS